MFYLVVGLGWEELIAVLFFLLPVLGVLVILGLIIYILWKLVKKVSKD